MIFLNVWISKLRSLQDSIKIGEEEKVSNIKFWIKKYRYQICIFLILFFARIAVNQLFDSLVNYSGADEVGTIASAAYFAGKDWSSIISYTLYYGWGYSLFMAPAFWITDSPRMLYQLLLAHNAVLLGLSAVICYNILSEFFNIKSKIGCAVISISCCCFYYNIINGNMIINENILSLLVWCILYLLLIMQRRYKEGKSNISFSILLGIILSYGLTIHMRVLFLYGGIVVVILTYYILERKSFIKLSVFGITCTAGWFVAQYFNSIIQEKLWRIGERAEPLTNSIESLGKIIENFSYLATGKGILWYLYTILGQTFVMFSYTGGVMAVFCIITFVVAFRVLKSIGKRKEVNTYYYTTVMFIGSLIIATMLLISVASLPQVLRSLEQAQGSKWLLYSRYWGIYCGMALMLTFVYFVKKSEQIKKILLTALAVFVVISAGFLILIAPVFNGTSTLTSGLFMLILPMMLKGKTTTLSSMDFVVVAIFGLLCFAIICVFVYKKKHVIAALVMCALFIYIWGYKTINVDIEASRKSYERYEGISRTIEEYGLDKKNEKIYIDDTGIITSNYDYLMALFHFNRYELVLVSPQVYNEGEENVSMLITWNISEETEKQWNIVFQKEEDKGKTLYFLIKNADLKKIPVKE